ncbi:hypothetical protein BD324DRAFT_681183 [Kockovaella imperatae]|uniref:Protein kinase domain-containing protein n=1 Tax=Kockovaella imperatae TaxID=4999 RepID=A0A1Y1UGW9_9TREE|nr:hypothetical protein BD324DRAFT_681183 [Kockovaella imperatae]ORX37272.1 hypothetical protein BD324DRAFT_681183 [Kockovaella imperatae]
MVLLIEESQKRRAVLKRQYASIENEHRDVDDPIYLVTPSGTTLITLITDPERRPERLVLLDSNLQPVPDKRGPDDHLHKRSKLSPNTLPNDAQGQDKSEKGRKSESTETSSTAVESPGQRDDLENGNPIFKRPLSGSGEKNVIEPASLATLISDSNYHTQVFLSLTETMLKPMLQINNSGSGYRGAVTLILSSFEGNGRIPREQPPPLMLCGPFFRTEDINIDASLSNLSALSGATTEFRGNGRYAAAFGLNIEGVSLDLIYKVDARDQYNIWGGYLLERHSFASWTHSTAMREIELYSTRMKDLQGTVVATCYGLWLDHGGQHPVAIFENAGMSTLEERLTLKDQAAIRLLYVKLHRRGVIHKSPKRKHWYRTKDGTFRLIDFSNATFWGDRYLPYRVYWRKWIDEEIDYILETWCERPYRGMFDFPMPTCSDQGVGEENLDRPNDPESVELWRYRRKTVSWKIERKMIRKWIAKVNKRAKQWGDPNKAFGRPKEPGKDQEEVTTLCNATQPVEETLITPTISNIGGEDVEKSETKQAKLVVNKSRFLQSENVESPAVHHDGG